MVLTNSCIVFDIVKMVYVVNRTCDTILIGRSNHNNIDSTILFLWHTGLSLHTDSMKMKEKLWIDNSNLIYPDSIGATSANYLTTHEKFYFFIIKLQIARNHSWEEICKNHLYDTLVITQEMLEQGNRIEYHGH